MSEKSPGAGDLHVRSGDLRSSIEYSLDRDGMASKARIGSNLKYARIHELGGTITPKKGDWLYFRGRDGGLVRTKQVKMPARPYLRPATMDRQREIEEAFARRFRQKFEGTMTNGSLETFTARMVAAMDSAAEAALLEVALEVQNQAKRNVTTPSGTDSE